MSIRDQLRGRSLPTEVVPLPVDPSAWTRAERALTSAQWMLEEARASGGRDTAALRARATEAQATLDGLACMKVTLRTLPPEEWEALVGLHPATDDQPGMQWNPTTFRPALLAECVVEDDDPLTAEDWAQVVKEARLSAGEYNTLCNAAVNLNLRGPSSAVGNGS